MQTRGRRQPGRVLTSGKGGEVEVHHDSHTRAALFDLDGVVVFTDRYHYLAWKRLADECGWAFDEGLNDACRGVPRLASLQVILDHNRVSVTPAEAEALAQKKNTYYVESLSRIGQEDVYPGSVQFIRRLRRLGMHIALCSSSKNAQTVLDRLGIAQLFDVVVTGADVTRPKPDPQIFLMASEKLGIPPQRCVVFEDAESGVEAARRAGMRCMGVGPAERLPLADLTFTDYATLDPESLFSPAGAHIEGIHQKAVLR